MLRSIAVLMLFALPIARAQEESPNDRLARVLESVSAEGEKAENRDAAMKDAARKALEANQADFETPDGPHFRGNVLQWLAGDSDAAIESFMTHAKADPKSKFAFPSLMTAAHVAGDVKGDPSAALKLLTEFDASQFTDKQRASIERTKSGLEADAKRAEMNGKPAPDFVATHVINGPATWKLSDLRGKVVVVDFFATWCPPCRKVVPELVKLQEEMGGKGVQVVSATRFCGYGMDFADPAAELPHGGKSVGARQGPDMLSEGDELKINETFVTAFKMNYPIVFCDAAVSKTDYSVVGIPTVFVIGTDGNIVGSIVGGGEENHKKLLGFIDEALAAKPAAR